MTENGRIFVKKWSFLGYQNQIRVAISRSSRNHSRSYFHQKLHHLNGFLRTYYCSQLDFPAWLNLYNLTIHEIQVLGKNDRKWPIFRQKVVIFKVPKSNSCHHISKQSKPFPAILSPKVASFKWLSKGILLFPARLSCLAESVQHDYSRNPGFGQK